HKTVRFLSILKMERRKISAETIAFEIDRRRGLVFHVSRVKSTFQRIHAAEQALEHGSFQKADGRPKQPTLDKAQRPPTTPPFQETHLLRHLNCQENNQHPAQAGPRARGTVPRVRLKSSPKTPQVSKLLRRRSHNLPVPLLLAPMRPTAKPQHLRVPSPIS